jgi:O-antigen/teichoic acid export membrane protein
MDSNYYDEIKSKIVRGVFALSTRTVILQIISFFSTLILTILLTPAVFGVFYIVSAVISFISYFSDIGLAASLVQKEGNLTEKELVSSFTIQQILVGLIVIIAFILTPYFTIYYKLGDGGVFLLRALLLSFLFSSLKTIPSVLLERKLEFSKLIIPQLLETIVFYLVTIILAYLGYGVWSFGWGALLRGIVGLIAIYVISPWKIGIGIDMKVSRKLLKFGMPFQLNSLLALIKDDLMTIFLGRILSFTQLGYLGWAKKWAEAPLRLIMDSIIRVTFPAFSRLQNNKELLSRAIHKSFFFLSLFIFPISFIFLIAVRPMIDIIPRYVKWEPALIPFYLYIFSSVMAALSSPVINAINALGYIKTSLKLMTLWTVLAWLITPLFVVIFGFKGVAWAAFVISFTSVIPIIILKRKVNISVISAIKKPLISSLVMAFVSYIVLNIHHNLFNVGFAIITSIIIYILFIVFFMRNEISPYIPAFIKNKF